MVLSESHTTKRQYECQFHLEGMYASLADLSMKARMQNTDQFVLTAVKQYLSNMLDNPELLMVQEFEWMKKQLERADEAAAASREATMTRMQQQKP